MSAVTRPIGRALGLSGGDDAPSGPSDEDLAEQSAREKRAREKELEEKKKIASANLTRRRGRVLMSDERENPATGVAPPTRTLGPERNPRA